MEKLKQQLKQLLLKIADRLMDLLDRRLIEEKLDMKDPYIWLATWGGSGLIKYAPGTFGTLAGLPLGIVLMMIGGSAWVIMGFLVICVIGYRAAHKFEIASGIHDSKAIVIDEVAGILMTLIVAAPSLISIAAAFLLFRLFDILKPWPVSWADKKLPGAAGVMADDILAGIYAAISLWGMQYAGLG